MANATSNYANFLARHATLNCYRLLRRNLTSARNVSKVNNLINEGRRRVLCAVHCNKFRCVVHASRVNLRDLRQGRLTTKGLLRDDNEGRVVRSRRYAIRELAIARVACMRLCLKVLRIVARIVLLFLIAAGSTSFLSI